MPRRAFRARSSALLAGRALGIAVVLLAFLGVTAAAAPQTVNQSVDRAVVRQAQVLESERTNVPFPAGLAFSPATNAFYVVGADRTTATAPTTTNVVTLKPFENRPGSDRAGTARLATTALDPVNMAFDARRDRLVLVDRADRLLEVRPRPDAELDQTTVASRGVLRLGLRSPQGLTVDPATGTVFVVDTRPTRILRVTPEADGSFESASVSGLDLGSTAIPAPRGIAFDSPTGHLHVRGDQKLYELTTDGEVVAVRDLSDVGLVDPQAMVFAPSGDRTDDPSQLSLYVADTGGGAARSAGQIVELSLTSQAEVAAFNFTSQVVNVVDMSRWDPPSTDPSGIAYIPSRDRLVMVDGEVEEVGDQGVTHFKGVNVWEFTRSGTVNSTGNVSRVPPNATGMNDEPVGVAWKESSDEFFVSSDSAKEVYRVNPGSDGRLGTAGDTWTSFDTLVHQNGDPEGITYADVGDRLFVADGVNAEVYEYSMAGAKVGQFDVARYGVFDPETVEYNPDNDSLFILSNRQSGPIIVETTRTGDLVQTIDVSSVYIQKPAGLAYAPSTNGSGKSFYIVDRGIDNDYNGNPIDGKMFELTAPGGGGGGNQPPTVNAGPNQTITLPDDDVALNGTVNDDGLPNPPGAVTATWSKQSGPGSVTFGNPNAAGTTATFSQAGPYVLRLTATDSALSSFDELTVTVNPSGGGGGGSALYFSLNSAATVGGVAAANEDIVFFDGTNFSLHFDGSDVGLGSFKTDAFARLDADSLLFSFDSPGSVPGIGGTVDDSDVVRFDSSSLGSNTAGSFSLYFDGSAFGLTEGSEDVDALELLGGDLLLSTQGALNATGLTAADEDLVRVSGGTFSLYFDGSDVGLTASGEDVDAIALDASQRIHLSTLDAFDVIGLSGQDEDVFRFTPTSTGTTTSGTFDSLYFDGTAFGLGGNDVLAADLP